MSDTVIKVENLSKLYRLGEVGTGTLSHDLNRWWHKVRGKEDPYLKIGQANDGSVKGDSDYVWALKDINFEVKRGEVLGIIGRNGAGKSTLLKILSRVTTPTSGEIKVKGRIASLLEVGTGFNPELTGRDNIYLNGAILGMRKREIDRKFDEIVDFSGVERYIDTPVKRYSSGMYVRLAFAVAAHLEPEILIVDEVLAVGDASFQKKCLGKMQDVSRNQGRTVLFVSHNIAAIHQLCSVALLLNSGQIRTMGETMNVAEDYLISSNSSPKEQSAKDLLKPHIVEVLMQNQEGVSVLNIHAGERATLTIKIETRNSKRLVFGLTVFNCDDIGIFSGITSDTFEFIPVDTAALALEIPTSLLNAGRYRVEGCLVDSNVAVDESECFLQFEIHRGGPFDLAQGKSKGLLRFPTKWLALETK